MKIKEKIVIGSLAVALVIALSIGGTLAFLTDTDAATNVFEVGIGLDIELEEPHWDPESGKDLTPGKTLPKDPQVIAVEGDSYMRVVVTYIDKNETIPNPAYVDEATTPNVDKVIANPNLGKEITDTTRLALIKQTIYFDAGFPNSSAIDTAKKYSIAELAALAGVNSGVNTVFTRDDDRSTASKDVYNYNEVFRMGDEVTLFTHAVIPTDWSQTEMKTLGKYDIVIKAEAIQIAGFENDKAGAYTALDAEIAKAAAGA